MKRRFASLLVAAVVLGVVQALVETVVFAVLHRELLLAPYRFFPGHSYDAFAKLYFLLAGKLPLPLLLQDFLAQGFAPKLVLAPGLVAVNVATATLVAALLAPLAGLAGVGRGEGNSRSLALVVGACLVLHLVVWALAFQSPEAATALKVAKALGRDALQGGVALALGILAVSSLGAAWILAHRAPLRATLAVAGLLFAIAASSGVPGAYARGPVQPPREVAPSPVAGFNVILVSIDSLRADHLGAYGYAKPTSPAIDAMASRGVVFRHSESTTSWTLPAHMSLLTGRSLLGHGVVSDDRSLSPSVGTIAEAFRSGGYATQAIVSAPYLNSRYGFPRGFDDYDDRTIHFETNEESYRSVTAPRLLEAAKAFLDGHHDRPFFLFLHSWDVHYDYAPGPPYDRMFDPDYTGTVDGNNFYFDPKIRKGMNPRDLEHLVALYDGEIRLVDDHLAKLREELERLGIADRTIVAVVGDHGDEFFEHGNKGHHRTLYREVLDVPFVLDVPGRKPAKAVVDDEASLIDVGPTLLGLAGLGAPDGCEGRDWSGLYTGAPLPTAGPVFAELYRTGTRNVQVAEIDARRKVIHHFQTRGLEAYDLAADAAEQHRLGPTGPLAEDLLPRLRDWLDGHWHRFDKRLRAEGIAPVVLDAKTREQLRSLGYLQ